MFLVAMWVKELVCVSLVVFIILFLFSVNIKSCFEKRKNKTENDDDEEIIDVVDESKISVLDRDEYLKKQAHNDEKDNDTCSKVHEEKNHKVVHLKNVELQKEWEMNYYQLCSYLQYKYGLVKKPYFTNDSFKNRSKGITRGNEGLVIHHIKEDEYVDLSRESNARDCPFEFQMPENLCYCNYLEHLILHMKIVFTSKAQEVAYSGRCTPGIRGILYYIVPEINNYFSGHYYSVPWRNKAFSLIDKDRDDYILILKKFRKIYLSTISNCPIFSYKDKVDKILTLSRVGIKKNN